MRLLFVEDEPDLREVLKKQLQGSGYSVDACGDGGAAGVRVVHLARADEGNFAYVAARLFGGRGNVCAYARDVFSNAHF